jgi:hypothetical protein
MRKTYVRKLSSDDVYLVDDVPISPGSAADYADQKILSIKRSDIAEVTITDPNTSYTLKVDDSNDGKIIMVNRPADRKLKDSECENIFSELFNVSFRDVKKETVKDSNLKFSSSCTCRLKTLDSYKFEFAEVDSATYVKCTAVFPEDLQIIKENRVESEEELKEKEAKLLARDRVEEFNEKHNGWLYEISDWKLKHLTKDRSDLLEEKEEKKEAAAEEEKEPEEEKSPPAAENDAQK